MKFLFFDIECANCFNAEPKVCEFGYVLTDENFTVLKKRDIPMSPGKGKGTSFDMKIRKFDPNFDWAYDISYYYSCPEFPTYYERIASLLKREDTLVFGFSVFNDVTYLDSAISIYGLERFDYRVNDIQKLASCLLKKKASFNLEGLFSSLCGKRELIRLQPHLSRDDAYMSMRILQTLCQKENLSPKELFQKYPHCGFSSLETLEKHYEKVAHQQESTERLKEGKRRWEEFCREGQSKHPWACPNSSLLKNPERLSTLIALCQKMGYGGAYKLFRSDVFLVSSKAEAEKAKSSLKGAYGGKIMTLEEFLKSSDSSPSS